MGYEGVGRVSVEIGDKEASGGGIESRGVESRGRGSDEGSGGVWDGRMR